MTYAIAPECLETRAHDRRPDSISAPGRPTRRVETPDFRRILDAAVDILIQGEALLGALSAEVYSQKLPVVFNGSIGGHYRHCLDHFSSLLGGLDSVIVDYDHRARDPRIERDPEFALSLTLELRTKLERLDSEALAAPVSARCEVSYEHGDSPVTQSSLGRELVYTIAHGIHHYALISVMARLLNAELPPHFGVAPSTVAHQKTVSRR